MFVSHGAPVLQPLEIYCGKPIFYSLGNFIFHVKSEKSPWRAREVWESVVGLCSFSDNGELAEISLHPVSIGGTRTANNNTLEERLAPERVHGEDAEAILHRFRQHSEKVGTRIRIVGGTGYLSK